jgi:hypothetical protein
MAAAEEITLQLPPLHEHQSIFGTWDEQNPNAQCLIAPCGTKMGKSFGAAWWITKELWINPGLYGVWIGPTYLKCRIGYRYVKAMLPDMPGVHCIDGKLEIHFPNGSFLKFLHGKDAETTVEGEAIDAFVIDESGKQKKQLWFSLLTTITQTRGKGIVTGTPRGFNWYYDEFRKAKGGDPFYAWAQLPTSCNPFVPQKSIAQAKRLLPAALYEQYYEAKFVSASVIFTNLSQMFDSAIKCNRDAKFWVHPDVALRKLDTVTGWDIAKHRDYSVFFTTTSCGKVVGYARFRRIPYDAQVRRLKIYLEKYFKESDKMVRYDATGVGSAVTDLLSQEDIDAAFTPVIFSNKSKQDMVSRTSMAIETAWVKAPPIEQIEHEFGSLEVKVTKSGLYSYAAPDGEHDDVVMAGMLSISGAFVHAQAEEAEKMMEDLEEEMERDDALDDDELDDAAEAFDDEDEFFDEDSDEEGDDDAEDEEEFDDLDALA